MPKAEIELEKQGIKVNKLPKKKDCIKGWTVKSKEIICNTETFEYANPIFLMEIKNESYSYYSKEFSKDSEINEFLRVTLNSDETILLNIKSIEKIKVGALYTREIADEVGGFEIGKKIVEHFFGFNELKEYK